MSFSYFSFPKSSTKLISVCPAKAVMLRSALHDDCYAVIPSHSESSKLPVPNKGSTHSAVTWLRSSECEITSRVWQAANKILKLGNWTEYVVARQYNRIMKEKNRNSTHGFFCHKRLGLKEDAMHGITPHLEHRLALLHNSSRFQNCFGINLGMAAAIPKLMAKQFWKPSVVLTMETRATDTVVVRQQSLDGSGPETLLRLRQASGPLPSKHSCLLIVRQISCNQTSHLILLHLLGNSFAVLSFGEIEYSFWMQSVLVQGRMSSPSTSWDDSVETEVTLLAISRGRQQWLKDVRMIETKKIRKASTIPRSSWEYAVFKRNWFSAWSAHAFTTFCCNQKPWNLYAYSKMDTGFSINWPLVDQGICLLHTQNHECPW